MHRNTGIRIFSLGLFLLFWHSLSVWLGDPQVLPSPAQVSNEMSVLWHQGKLQENLAATGWRVAAAFGLAMIIGGVLGYAMGRSDTVDAWLDPWLIIFLNLPALVLIVLCYLWVGLNEFAAVLAVTLSKVPMTTTIIREGSRNASSALRDLASVYRLSLLTRLRHIVLPELFPHIVSAARTGFSVIWKIVLVVEFLGRPNGIGRQIHTQFSLFDVTGVLAYALSFVICILFIEFAIMQPSEKRVGRWRVDAEA
ncbi:Putative aliphatic sulfonates transport permease protein SsuC [Aliiroseovarius pelagivivens]|uniref:Aliphatic sulfonates transport permease protein SsuC n=1 Tax=Aliiroseovarius pelagivivens TaxID=1639690 RepID=A0A2R8AHH3_9RHOB|nr:ABC transporter permease [Aliiroseovarius pelagivivens]SPF75485.1 Putative aliphatic sulfonates transport permease protein SsuC [Aliiroseovarius pelagivivens]